MSLGKLIVIDGTDGSGKATQTRLLVRRLKRAGRRVAEFDFPQYGKKSAGPVEEYLNGLYGTALELGPYIPSMFYAVDRFSARDKILQALNSGAVVISNRYVTASMGHQGGKIRDGNARAKYYKWLNELEYGFFKLPKPSLNLILHMPAKVAQALVGLKGKRNYINGAKKDLHEKDLSHLISAEKAYLEIHKKFGYPLVECFEKGNVLTREEIAERIWSRIKKIL